jgi:crossover junction endodeoxyribonuclease RuvC
VGGVNPVILGIDPGSVIAGYGVIRVEGDEPSAVKWGVLRARKSDPLPKRLLTIHRSIIELIDTFAPQAVAVERAFYGNNVKALMAMGQSVGVVLLASAEREVDVFEYTPREVKKAVVGNGGASKEQIQRMVCAILNLNRSEEPLDATDALAVALCHENRTRDPVFTSR